MTNSFHISGRLISDARVIKLQNSFCAEIKMAIGVDTDTLIAAGALDFADDMFGTDDIGSISSDIKIFIYSKNPDELINLKKGEMVTVDGYHTNKRYCKNKRWQTKVCLVAKSWSTEEGRAEKAKFYHLELADLTPEHNLYYSDLVSTRVKNVLGAADIYTLNDICHLSRTDFLRYRNCGKVATDEVEKLLHAVGLDWNTPVPHQEQVIDLSTVPDDALLEECRKRNLKI